MKILAETERLILREILPQDEDGLFEMDSDPEVHRYLGNEPVQNREQIREVIRYIRRQYTDNGIGRWAVTDRHTHRFLGWAGLKLVTETVNGHTGYHDLGYRFMKQHWGRGYATEAARAVLDYGFDRMHLDEIYAMADCGNAASDHVLTKAGFTRLHTFDFESTPHHWYKMEKAPGTASHTLFP